MNGGFAGGLAAGINNGVELYTRYADLKRRKDEEKREREITEAMRQGGQPGLADAAPQAQAGASAAQAGTPGLDAALAGAAGARIAPGGGPAPTPTVDLTGGQGLAAAAPGGPQAAAPERPALAGAELDQLADSLARGYRKALEVGDPGRAMQLLLQREKVMGQYRDDAYRGAMSQFELTGDPNALVPFVNRFMPGRMEIRGVEARNERGGGQPVYMVRAFDPTTGRESSQPFSLQHIRQFASSIADPATHRAMVVDQAKALYDLEIERRKKQAAAEIDIDKERQLQPLQTAGRIEEIRARGEEARKTADHTAKVGDRTAAPAEVRTAQWLMDNGVAKDAGAAWDMVRGARTKSRQDFVADMAKTLLGNQDPMAFGENRLTPQQAVDQAGQLYDSLVADGQRGGNRATAPAAPSPGAIEDGWRFKGGDPADESNWEKV